MLKQEQYFYLALLKYITDYISTEKLKLNLKKKKEFFNCLNISFFISKRILLILWTYPGQENVESKTKCNDKNREYNEHFDKCLKNL
jgi:hypothetical protein